MSPTELQALLADAASIRSLARALVREPGAAEEVAQEAVLRRMAAGDAGVRSRAAWLAGLVRNTAAGLRRSEARRSARERRAARPEAVPSVAEMLEAEDLRRAVVEAVMELGEPHRAVMVLHHLQQRPMPAVAAELGVPLETVRTRNKRGLELVRERLDRCFGSRADWAVLVGPALLEPGAGAGLLSSPLSLTLFGMTLSKSLVPVGLALAAVALWPLLTSEGREPAEPATEAEAPARTAAALAAEPTVPEEPPAEPESAGAPRVQPKTAAAGGSAAPATCGVRIELVEAESGAPLPGLRVVWTQGDFGDARAATTVSAADEHGVIELAGLAPGLFRLQHAGLAGEELGLLPGSVGHLRVEVPRGITVYGRVLDPDGRPVAGAEVLVEGLNAPTYSTFAAAVSDAEGRYEVRNLSANNQPFIGARAAGFGPGAAYGVQAAAGARVEHDLRVGEPGAGLFGEVVDADGNPVPGAVVRLGESSRRSMENAPGGGIVLSPAPARRITDAAGRFQALDLAPGPSLLTVEAAGHSPLTESFELTEGVDQHLRLRLEPQAGLRGVVRDASGAPVEGALVVVSGGTASSAFAWTDAAGNYEIEACALGEREARAESRGYPTQRARVTSLPGEVQQLDFQFEPGAVLEGRVESGSRSPEGWIVGGRGRLPDGTFVEVEHDAAVAADGSFRLEGLDSEASYDLSVQDRDSWRMLALARDLRPGDAGVVIEVDPELFAERTAWLVGRVVDVAGAPVLTATYTVTGPGADGTVRTLDEEDGSFRAGPFPPGSYSVRVRSAEHAMLVVPAVSAQDGDVVDLGPLVLEGGGTVEVTFSRDPGVTEGFPEVVLRGEGIAVRFRESEGRAVSQPASAGSYRVEIYGLEACNVAHRLIPVEVRAGEVTRVEVHLERGYRRGVRVERPAALGGDRAFGIEVLDPDGRRVLEGELDWSEHQPALQFELQLAAGEYRFRMTAAEGVVLDEPANFGPGEEGSPLELELSGP